MRLIKDKERAPELNKQPYQWSTVTMSTHSSIYHSNSLSSGNMKLLVIIIVAVCFMATEVKAKPIFSLKVVQVPVVVPKVNILGAVSKILGIKAALIGHTLKTKANILQNIATIKGGLGAFLTSSVPQEPVYLTAIRPVESEVVIKKPTLPSPTYGAPPPELVSTTYGAPYPA